MVKRCYPKGVRRNPAFDSLAGEPIKIKLEVTMKKYGFVLLFVVSVISTCLAISFTASGIPIENWVSRGLGLAWTIVSLCGAGVFAGLALNESRE